MIPFNRKSTHAALGFMLIEVALVILILAVMLGPVLHLLANQNQKDKLLVHLQTRQIIVEAVESFVLAHGLSRQRSKSESLSAVFCHSRSAFNQPGLAFIRAIELAVDEARFARFNHHFHNNFGELNETTTTRLFPA